MTTEAQEGIKETATKITAKEKTPPMAKSSWCPTHRDWVVCDFKECTLKCNYK